MRPHKKIRDLVFDYIESVNESIGDRTNTRVGEVIDEKVWDLIMWRVEEGLQGVLVDEVFDRYGI